MTEPSDIESALAWLVDNSEGVVGLRADRSVMPWDEVLSLYLPWWSAQGADHELRDETGIRGITYPDEDEET